MTVADGAYVAAGSTVTGDVAPGDLAVARARQVNKEGWVAKRMPGTVIDEAAKRAAGGSQASGE